MAKTRDKVLDKAGGARPYIERALTDEDLLDNVRNAFESARESCLTSCSIAMTGCSFASSYFIVS